MVNIKEKIKKKEKIRELLFDVSIHEIHSYFDIESEELLDEKIEVLTALKNGKNIKDIPNYYNILELMPKKGEMWD